MAQRSVTQKSYPPGYGDMGSRGHGGMGSVGHVDMGTLLN